MPAGAQDYFTLVAIPDSQKLLQIELEDPGRYNPASPTLAPPHGDQFEADDQCM